MSKNEMIQAICGFNRSAHAEFLERFSDRTLLSYLRRLQMVQGPRGPRSRWVRDGETTAIVVGAAR